LLLLHCSHSCWRLLLLLLALLLLQQHHVGPEVASHIIHCLHLQQQQKKRGYTVCTVCTSSCVATDTGWKSE
jgi:hypothetical protein